RADSAAETQENAEGAELHQKLLEFLAVALGPATTALALVTSAITSLQAMNKGSPWITLFNRRARDASAASVQVTETDVDESGSVSVKGTGVRVEASQEITQVLFFKFRSNNAKLFRSTISMEIPLETLNELAPDIHG